MSLRVITVPREGTRAAAVLVLVKTGSKYEEKRDSGISHFLEHMLFKGTEKRTTPLAVAEELDKVGGAFNAFTAEDYTGYYAKVNGKSLDLAIDWVSDIYQNSLLPEKEVEKEKGVIKEEINMRYDDPISFCDLLFQKLLYGDQPAGWDIAGTKESVSAITRKDLLEYMQSQYTEENTVVVVSGNIDSGVEERVRSSFSLSGTPKDCLPVKEEQSGVGFSFYEKKTDQTHICLGVRAFNMLNEKRHTQKIIATILGGMMSSRLFTRIREEMGAAYYVSTHLDDNPHTGVILTRTGVDSNRAQLVVDAIMEEYKKISEERVSDAELQKAKDYIKGKTALSLEPSDALAYFYGMQELLQGKVLELEEVFSLIDQVTADDILAVSREIFVPSKVNLAILGPRSVSL